MSSGVVKIENLNKILSGLRKAGVNAQDLKIATTKASSLVLPPARALTPVKTGELQRTVKASKAKNKVAISAGTPTSTPYGAVVHWGWKKKSIEPNPWLLKVRDQYEDEVADLYVTELQRLIDENLDGIK
jgi:HK97 gp10 family phage protein